MMSMNDRYRKRGRRLLHVLCIYILIYMLHGMVWLIQNPFRPLFPHTLAVSFNFLHSLSTPTHYHYQTHNILYAYDIVMLYTYIISFVRIIDAPTPIYLEYCCWRSLNWQLMLFHKRLFFTVLTYILYIVCINIFARALSLINVYKLGCFPA